MKSAQVEVRQGAVKLPVKVDAPKEIALDRLQTAILRLASKPSARPTGFGRQELGSLVEKALEAYRQYMQVVSPS